VPTCWQMQILFNGQMCRIRDIIANTTWLFLVFFPLFWHPLRGFKCRKLAKFDFVSDLILYFHYFQPVLPLVNIYIFIFFCSTPSCSGFNLCAMGDCSADMTRHTYSHIFVVPASELPFHPAERKPSQLAYKTLTSAKVGLK